MGTRISYWFLHININARKNAYLTVKQTPLKVSQLWSGSKPPLLSRAVKPPLSYDAAPLPKAVVLGGVRRPATDRIMSAATTN